MITPVSSLLPFCLLSFGITLSTGVVPTIDRQWTAEERSCRRLGLQASIGLSTRRTPKLCVECLQSDSFLVLNLSGWCCLVSLKWDLKHTCLSVSFYLWPGLVRVSGNHSQPFQFLSTLWTKDVMTSARASTWWVASSYNDNHFWKCDFFHCTPMNLILHFVNVYLLSFQSGRPCRNSIELPAGDCCVDEWYSKHC